MNARRALRVAGSFLVIGISTLLVERAVTPSPHAAASVPAVAGPKVVRTYRSTAPSTQPRPVSVGMFARRSCVLYPPTARDRHRTVFLDAGNSDLNPGAVGTTGSGQSVRDAELTLQVARRAVPMLRRQGFTVVMSRTGSGPVARLAPGDTANGVLTDQGVQADVQARDRCANRSGARALVSISFNAGASSQDAGSITGYDTVRTFAERNLQLAQLVQADVLASLNSHGWQIPDGGVAADSLLGGSPTSAATAAYGRLLLGTAGAGSDSSASNMPGALIEPLFLTDPFEATIAASGVGQAAIAAGLTKAVIQFLPRARTEPKLSSTAPDESLVAESSVRGVPVAYVWRAAPAGPGQGPVTVAAFDPHRTRLVLHAGTIQPGSSGPWLNGPQVGAAERSQVLAAFNSGFKMVDARGGWSSESHTVVPLVTGAASVVIYADGGFDIGTWGRGVPAPNRVVASVRQNLQLLIDQGQPQLQNPASQNQLEQWWGVTFGGAALVSRSAIGITPHGTLLFAAGTDVTITALTDALLAHGAVRAMELDINAPMVRGFLYPGAGTVTPPPQAPDPALPLVAGQTQTAADYTASGTGPEAVPHCTFVTTCSRDFFTVIES